MNRQFEQAFDDIFKGRVEFNAPVVRPLPTPPTPAKSFHTDNLQSVKRIADIRR